MKTIVYSIIHQLKHYVAIFCIGIFCSLGIGGCSQDSDLAKLPEATDDATLLASQLKLLQTRATNATNTTLITTAKSVNFTVENSSPIIVDWGDGNNDIDVFAHTYTDDLPVHTICFNGAQDAIKGLDCQSQEVIFLNINKNLALRWINCQLNRLTQLNVTENTNLGQLDCHNNQLTSLDLTHNQLLYQVDCTNNQLTTLLPSKNGILQSILCGNNPFEYNFDVLVEFVQNLPVKTENEVAWIFFKNIPDDYLADLKILSKRRNWFLLKE